MLVVVLASTVSATVSQAQRLSANDGQVGLRA